MAYLNVHDQSSGDDEQAMKRMRDVLGPGHIDQSIRQAIQFCWMSLPPDRRAVDDLEKEVRRIVERALSNLREDAKAFEPPVAPPNNS